MNDHVWQPPRSHGYDLIQPGFTYPETALEIMRLGQVFVPNAWLRALAIFGLPYPPIHNGYYLTSVRHPRYFDDSYLPNIAKECDSLLAEKVLAQQFKNWRQATRLFFLTLSYRSRNSPQLASAYLGELDW